MLCTGTGVGERDAEVASAASVHFPTPLHAPELAHGLYVPATSPCYGISSASGDSSPVGAPRPAGGTGVGNSVQPPATISTGLDHLYCLQPASARRRAPRGPGRGGLGEYWVYIAAVISGPATAGPGSQVTKGFRHGRFLTPGFTPLKLKLKLRYAKLKLKRKQNYGSVCV